MRTKVVKVGEDLEVTIQMRGPLGIMQGGSAPLVSLFRGQGSKDPYDTADLVFKEAILEIKNVKEGKVYKYEEYDLKNDLNFSEFNQLFVATLDFWGLQRAKDIQSFRPDTGSTGDSPSVPEIPKAPT